MATQPFSTLLKRYRARARLSQEGLAEQAGLSLRAVSDLERGVNRMPRNACAGYRYHPRPCSSCMPVTLLVGNRDASHRVLGKQSPSRSHL